ncbi:hypothetical protein D3C80_1839990 [compost metagenome]
MGEDQRAPRQRSEPVDSPFPDDHPQNDDSEYGREADRPAGEAGGGNRAASALRESGVRLCHYRTEREREPADYFCRAAQGCSGLRGCAGRCRPENQKRRGFGNRAGTQYCCRLRALF